MNKETLHAKLCNMITNGYLEGVYADDNMSVFCFLKTVWLGFLHENVREEPPENENPAGVLLTETEANVIIRSKSCCALRFLEAQETSCLFFSEQLIAMCGSPLGRWRIKRQIKKKYYYQAKTGKKAADLPDRIDKSAAFDAIYRVCEERKECISRRRSNLKTVKILGAIALGCVLISMLHPMTIDLREQWNPERSAAVFDKKGEDGVYAYVEADLLTRLALVEGYGVSAWYCLYGNLEKGTYGVVRFSELYEEYILLGEDEKTAVFPEPLLLYGLTMEMPACIEGLPLEQPAQSDPVIIPGTTAVLPDGTELEIPDREAPQVTVSDEIVLEEIIEEDSSREAMAFFANYGIDVSTDWTPGSVYLAGSVQPETDEAPINQFLDTVWIILLLLAFVLLIPLFRYGSRADYEEVIIQRINRGDSMIPMLADTCTRQEKERMEIPEPGNE